MSGAAVQDGISGDLQREFGLEALTVHAVGALRPPIAQQSFSDEVKQIRGQATDDCIPKNVSICTSKVMLWLILFKSWREKKTVLRIKITHLNHNTQGVDENTHGLFKGYQPPP